ncbi:unnamed protein product [Fusarium venenatum]|uniref:Uncharacterized protein n=1 Tax=Fusarium venenatum TaxID=56646 RepID=A0A2L2TI48_9HYPO|nr:uncharacterized protein FVRRES_09845 [Fusarium venenatum]CEI69768.1 unnamed protein product [Fusarium venenatum]
MKHGKVEQEQDNGALLSLAVWQLYVQQSSVMEPRGNADMVENMTSHNLLGALLNTPANAPYRQPVQFAGQPRRLQPRLWICLDGLVLFVAAV